MPPPPDSPRRIRVLVIDDSAVVRKMVSDALGRDAEIEVVGTANDPFAAKDKIIELKPDVLTLDLEMPRMDGLTFLKLLMERRPLPVIIMSSLTQAGSDAAMEALRLGAVDVLGKPNGPYSFGDLGPQLISKIKAAAIARLPVAPARPPAAAASTTGAAGSAAPFTPRPAPVPPPRRSLPATGGFHPRQVIVLGASTGGTEALREVLTELPAGLPGIAIVQHIPAYFSGAFARRLDSMCAFRVREAQDGDVLEPGTALIAPGNFHMILHWQATHYRVRITSGPPVWHQRPAVDLLFKSAAEAAGAHAIAGLLTGMGKDGAEGMLRMKEKGASTFAQDEATSIVYGMPRVAWEMGAAQLQVPLPRMAGHLLSLLSQTRPQAAAV